VNSVSRVPACRIEAADRRVKVTPLPHRSVEFYSPVSLGIAKLPGLFPAIPSLMSTTAGAPF